MSASTAKVTAVIVAYESRETIGAALRSLAAAKEVGLAECIVVDNASTDGTAEFVEREYPWVQVVRSAKNIGFGRGCNVGFELARTDYVLLLNPDAALNLDSLQQLVTFADEHPKAGICAPAVEEDSGKLQPAGGLPTPWRCMLKPLLPAWATRGQRHVVPGEPPSRTDWVCGSILMIRRELIGQIGGFDPRFFLYFEETDLCRRAQQKGWEVWTIGTSVGHHVNAASAKATKAPMIWGTLSEHYFRSRFYYMIKHFGWPSAVIAEVGEIMSMTLRALVDVVRGRSYQTLALRLRAPILKLPQNDAGVGSEHGCQPR